jgi:hypothetical protein
LGANVKLAETERVISAYVDGLKLADAVNSAAYLQSIAGLLKEFPDRTMADLVKCYRRAQQQYRADSQHRTDGPTVVDVLPHLEAVVRILKAGRSPTGQIRDLGLLIDLLRSSNASNSDSRYLSSMLKMLRQVLSPRTPEKVVREFVDRLKAAKGSDQFEQVLSELANSDLKKEHLIEVARAVYGGVPRSLSRKAALAYIRKPHDAYLSAKRGIEATGGRSAA